MALIGTNDAAQLARKEQQLVFLLVRQLADAQMHGGNPERCERLWQEAAALDLDPERIIWLLYGGQNLNDPVELEQLDQRFRAECRQSIPRGQHRFRLAFPGGGRRNAPRATAPAHPAGR